MSRKAESAIALLGLIVAALALIPAFGQWLFPREDTAPPIATPTPTVEVAVSPAVTPTEQARRPTLRLATPTPDRSTPDNLPDDTPVSAVADKAELLIEIAAECDATQHVYTELPVAAQVTGDGEMGEDVAFVKRFVVLAMELTGAAVLTRDASCLHEVYAGVPLQEVELLAAGDPFSPLVYKSRFEWDFSQLVDVRRASARRLEADVCLFQGLDAYNAQGVLTMSYPAEYAAATMVLEQQGEAARYYITALVELDPFVYCQ